MTVLKLPPGNIDPDQIGERWVLIFGGVTRQGNRAARRSAAEALEAGVDVVWFDGFVEKVPDSGARVPLDVETVRGDLVIVEFEEAEARSFASRLRTGKTMQSNALTKLVWRLFTRRLGSILRPRACWGIVRPDVEALARDARPPGNVVYGDDTSITSAWHAAHIWPEIRVATTVLVGTE